MKGVSVKGLRCCSGATSAEYAIILGIVASGVALAALGLAAAISTGMINGSAVIATAGGGPSANGGGNGNGNSGANGNHGAGNNGNHGNGNNGNGKGNN